MLERAITLPPALSAFTGAHAAPRGLVEQIIEDLVAALDTADGDPDLEADNSDSEPDDDGKGDPSWPEWQSRGRHKLQQEHEPIRRANGWTALEDDEDDDPAEDDDPDKGVDDDGEGIDEREPQDHAGVCFHFTVDQTTPLNAVLGQRVAIDAIN